MKSPCVLLNQKKNLPWSGGRVNGRGSEEASLLELEFVELLFAIHLDDQWDHEDQERGAGNPGRFPRASEQLLRYVNGVACSFLATIYDLRVR